MGQSEIHRSDRGVGSKLPFTCLQVNKVEKFKRSQAKEDALHAKYNLSEWLQVLIFFIINWIAPNLQYVYFTVMFYCIFIFHFQQLRLIFHYH